MTDTLLQIAQDVTDEIGLERVSTVVGNTNDTARRILQAAQRTGKMLAKTHYWTVLQTEHTFQTASSTASYDLPSDFDRMLPWTQWDRSNEWRLRGPTSPQGWQFVKSGIAEEGPRRDYRIKPESGTNKFFLSPTPGAGEAGETLAFEYVSQNWCESSGGTGQAKLQADDDTIRLDEELFRLGVIWRLKAALGMEYQMDFDAFFGMLRVRKAGEFDMPRLRMDRRSDVDPNLAANIQDANFPSS